MSGLPRSPGWAASAGAEFLIERFRNDSSYRAQAAAVTALGEIGGDAAAAIIEEAAAMASPRDIIARAARNAFRDAP